MQARIAGTVKLELSADPNSGEVGDIKVVLGHPIFLPSVMGAVKRWQFVPEELPAKASQIPADFRVEMPEPLQPQAGGSGRYLRKNGLTVNGPAAGIGTPVLNGREADTSGTIIGRSHEWALYSQVNVAGY